MDQAATIASTVWAITAWHTILAATHSAIRTHGKPMFGSESRSNLGKMRQLELLGETFNLFNHRNVTEVETIGYSVASGGQNGTFPTLTYFTGLKANSTAFGQPLNSNSTSYYRERQIQLGSAHAILKSRRCQTCASLTTVARRNYNRHRQFRRRNRNSAPDRGALVVSHIGDSHEIVNSLDIRGACSASLRSNRIHCGHPSADICDCSD